MEDWIGDLAEFGPGLVRQACSEYRRRPGHVRPGSGDIRQICITLANERAEHAAIRDQRQDRWPAWLEELWGPWPEGAKARAEALRRKPLADADGDPVAHATDFRSR